MKLRQVPAHHGVIWVRQGFRVFWQRPFAFCGLFVIYMIMVQVSALIWPIGSVAACAAIPIASLAFMIATNESLHGRFPTPGVYAQPFRIGRAMAVRQLKLSLLYAAAMLGLMAIAWHIGGDAFNALQDAVAAGTTDPHVLGPLLLAPELQTSIWLMLTGLSMLAVPFWHAPALVHWAAQGVAQSLFSSTLAVWRNKAALALFILTWGATVMAFLIAAQLVFALLGMPQLVVVATMPGLLLFATVYYVSLYFSFTDSFERSAPPPSDDAPPIAHTPLP